MKFNSMENTFKKGDFVESIWRKTEGEVGLVVVVTNHHTCYVRGFSGGSDVELNGETLYEYDFNFLKLISRKNQDIEFYAKYL